MNAIQSKQPRLATITDSIVHVFQTINQPKYHWITRPLLAFVVTRFIVFLSAYLAEVAIPGMTGDGLYHINASNVFLDVWARWDSAFYLRIVTDGYFFQPGLQSSVAFFPVYPLLVSFITPIVGSPLAGGVIVSHLCFFGALVFLYRLTEFEFQDSGAASRAVFYIASFPTAFFFSAVYTESTFLMLVIGTMYFARRQLWAWAALFGMMTSGARIIGVVMFGVVGLEWLRAHGWTLTTIHQVSAWRDLINGIRRHWATLLMLSIIPLGLITYMVFLKIQFNDPVAFSTTQSAWGREMLGPLAIVWRDLTGFLRGNFLTGEIWYHVMLDLTAFFAVLGISIAIWRRLGASYALYGIISIVIPAWSGTGSLSRYALVVFPMFMMLGNWGRYSWLDRLVIVSFSVLLGVLATVFVNWVFVA